MRAFKIVLVIVALAFAALIGRFYFGPLGPASPYHRFHTQGRDYYSRLARACDTVLKQHASFTRHTDASTNTLIWMDRNNVVWDQIRVAPNDPSLPDPVRTLRPDEILLAPNRVFIGFGGGRLGWAVSWEQDDMQTNRWKLDSNGDGLVRTVYAETR